MPPFESKYLDEIHPAVDYFKVNVKFDRSFNREVIHFVGPSGVPMKEVVSIDIVVYDEQGTLMLAKLRSEESRDRFMRKIRANAIYEVVNPSVECGGEGIHEDYHLEFHEHTYLNDVTAIFPPLPYRLMRVSDITRASGQMDGFFDVLGFVRFCSPILNTKHMGFCEKAIHIILAAGKNASLWHEDVRCILRGGWVEAVEKLVRNAMNECEHVFVHVRYVISCKPVVGLPTVTSYSDASSLDINPMIPQVQLLKQLMSETQ